MEVEWEFTGLLDFVDIKVSKMLSMFFFSRGTGYDIDPSVVPVE